MADEQVAASAESSKESPWIDDEHYRRRDGTIGTRTGLRWTVIDFLMQADPDQEKLFFDFVEVMAKGPEWKREHMRKVVCEIYDQMKQREAVSHV